MKLSRETLDILKNFAAINPSILLRRGSRIKTITPQKNVMASANIAETLPREVAIYDLNQFLGTISLFNDPDFEFGERSVEISDATGAVAMYTYAAKEAIIAAPDKDVVLPSTEVTFDLDEKLLAGALKAASVMGLPNVAFHGNTEKVYLEAYNATNVVKSQGPQASTHNWKAPVGSTKHAFNMIYRLEVLKLLPRDYEVTISSKLITRFESKVGDVTYYVAAESGSTFS